MRLLKEYSGIDEDIKGLKAAKFEYTIALPEDEDIDYIEDSILELIIRNGYYVMFADSQDVTSQHTFDLADVADAAGPSIEDSIEYVSYYKDNK